MVEEARKSPEASAVGASRAAGRDARLAAALRANLTRRKAQARGRDAALPDAARDAVTAGAADATGGGNAEPSGTGV